MAQTLGLPTSKRGTALQEFMKRALAPQTRKSYRKQLDRFIVYLHDVKQLEVRTYDDLIYSDIDKGIKRDVAEVNAWLEAYVLHLIAKGLKKGSIMQPIWAAWFLYEKCHAVALPTGSLTSLVPDDAIREGEESEAEARNGMGYEKQHVRDMMRTDSDPRAAALDTFLLSTGIRVGALEKEYEERINGKYIISPGLYMRHLYRLDAILPDLPEYAEYRRYRGYLVLVYAGTEAEYYTFTTPESTDYLNAYFDYRRRHGETLTKDSPLFRDVFNPANKKKALKPLRRQGAQAYYKRMQGEIGLRPVSDGTMDKAESCRIRRAIPAVHGFRKATDTALTNCKLHPDFRKFLLGHDNGLQANYYDTHISESVVAVLSEYLKAVEALTISQEVKLQKQVEALKIEVAEKEVLKAQVARIMAELQRLRE